MTPHVKPGRARDADIIKIFPQDSPERARLDAAARLAQLFAGEDLRTEETWFDFGQGWQWTTLIHHKKSGAQVQVLSPATQARICLGDYSEFTRATGELLDRLRRERRA